MSGHLSPALPPTSPPRAAVVGAGIAGLSAAIALRRAGWRVDVFERSRFRNETGAAISVPPNATRVLGRWGFDFAAAHPVPNQQTRVARAADLQLISANPYPDIAEKLGCAAWSFHRVDLHRGLRGLATGREGGSSSGSSGGGSGNENEHGKGGRERERPGGGDEGGAGVPVDIKLGCEVARVDCDKGELTLADGQVEERDLVIIADGAHSRLVECLTGKPAALRPQGESIYRWLVSMDDILADPDLRPLFDVPLKGFLAIRDPDTSVFWATYTCRDNTVLNNAVIYPSSFSAPAAAPPPESLSGSDTKSKSASPIVPSSSQPPACPSPSDVWHTSAPPEQVLATLANFHPAVRRIVRMASEDGIVSHRLYLREAMPSFTRGRALVIGDAAHVMKPSHAAGGAISIESAAAIEVLFRGYGAPRPGSGERELSIKDRMKLFDELRVPRCNLTMLASNAGPRWLGVPGLEEEIRKYYAGPLPPAGSLPWSEPFREVLFHHDEFAAAEMALARARGSGEGE